MCQKQWLTFEPRWDPKEWGRGKKIRQRENRSIGSKVISVQALYLEKLVEFQGRFKDNLTTIKG